MISPEDKAKLLKFVSEPTSNVPAWVATVVRHFIEEHEAAEQRLIELDDALAEAVSRYEEQINYLRVLLANSGWQQDADGEWARHGYPGAAVMESRSGRN